MQSFGTLHRLRQVFTHIGDAHSLRSFCIGEIIVRALFPWLCICASHGRRSSWSLQLHDGLDPVESIVRVLLQRDAFVLLTALEFRVVRFMFLFGRKRSLLSLGRPVLQLFCFFFVAQVVYLTLEMRGG